MKFRILILCKDFPPSNRIGGKRPYAWFKYLPEFGVDATVITATPGKNAEVLHELHRVDCKLENLDGSSRHSLLFLTMRKIRSFFEYWLPFIFPCSSRYHPIIKKAKNLLNENEFDCIIATGEPFILFRFAADLSDEFSIPWIPDYRDNWSNNKSKSFASPFIRFGNYYRWIEERLLKRSNYVTCVGEETARRIQLIDPVKTPIVIENGHDIPTDFVFQPPPQDRLILTHVGRIYQHKNPKILFEAILKWQKSPLALPLELRFIGLEDFPNQIQYLHRLAGELAQNIVTTPSMEYNDMLKMASGSHVFLNFSIPGNPMIPGKVYDYIGMNRKVLVVPGDKIINQLIHSEKCGYIGSTTDEILSVLEELAAYINQPEHFVTNIPLERYSRRSGAKQLAKIITEICAE